MRDRKMPSFERRAIGGEIIAGAAIRDDEPFEQLFAAEA